MRTDKFTVKVQDALAQADLLAGQHSQQQIEPIHLLCALVQQEDGVVPAILKKLGAEPSSVLEAATREMERLPAVSGSYEKYTAPALRKILEHAFKEMDTLKDEFVSAEHIILAMARVFAKTTAPLAPLSRR